MEKSININNMPKAFKILLAIFPLFFILAISFKLDNDFYFLYPTGEYIINNGFPTHDFLSMHGNMEIIIQQWLSTIIFYLVYSNLGKVGMYALMIITYLLFAFISYRLYILITDNHFLSCVMAAVTDFAIAQYTTTRPQIFTYIIIITELFLLEKYVKTGKVTSLLFMPVLSVILVNMHSSMWAMLFVFMLPYIVAALPFEIKKLNFKPCCKILPLIITAIVSAVAGLINPYGLKAMTYITTSFGYDEISNLIREMQYVKLTSLTGSMLYAAIAITVIFMIFRKGDTDARFFFLYAGLTVFSLLSFKSIPYFFIGGLPAFSYFVRDYSFNLKVGKSNKKSTVPLLLAVIIAVAGVGGIAYSTINDTTEIPKHEIEKVTPYGQLDSIIDILDEKRENGEEITLFTGFNEGQYLEFNGYHPYIDGRAELFLDDNNNDFNYMKEYYNLRNAGIYYKDFIEKYQFNYLIVSESDRYLLTCIQNDDDYELLYNGKEACKLMEEKYNAIHSDDNDSDSFKYLFAVKDR